MEGIRIGTSDRFGRGRGEYVVRSRGVTNLYMLRVVRLGPAARRGGGEYLDEGLLRRGFRGVETRGPGPGRII